MSVADGDRRLADWFADHLRGAAWMDEAGRAASEFVIVDSAVIEAAAGRRDLLLVAPAELPQRWYAVLADQQGRPLADAAAACPVLDELVIDGMRRQRRIQTRHGGALSFHGSPPPWQSTDAFDFGWSSNTLSMLRLDGLAHVHKRYRIVSTQVHEPEILRRMRGSESVPEYLGDYAYVSPAGARYPLGLVYRYVAGEPLESLLRANLRTLWMNLPAGRVSAGTAITSTLDPVAALLREVGSLIRRLHRGLAASVAPVGPFAVEACLAQTQDLVRAVTAQLAADPDHAPHVRDAIAAAIARAVAATSRRLAGLASPPAAGGICHGDLHLPHLVCQSAADGSWSVRAIDISAAAVDAADPRFAHQSPWQDLAAVQRGLESLSTHEAAVEAARVLGADRRETCRVAVHEATDLARVSSITSPSILDGPSAERVRLFGAADSWSAAALRLVVEGYDAALAAAVDPAVGPGHPLWRLLYLRRLLHELGYNYAHRRKYQVNVDLRHAASLASTGLGR